MAKVDFGRFYGSWLFLMTDGIGLITSMDKNGKPNVMTASSISPIGSGYVVLSVGWTRYSHDLIRDSREFVINIPDVSLYDNTRIFGSKSGRECEKLKLSGLTIKPARRVKPPIIDECIAHLECRVVDQAEIRRPQLMDPHTVFVGEVLEAYGEKNLGKVLLSGRVLNKFKPIDALYKEKEIADMVKRTDANLEGVMLLTKTYYKMMHVNNHDT